MAVYTDQTGTRIELSRPPQRIVSLVPSQTELLWSLGLNEEVVGITKFCVHPRGWFHSKTRIGGTKQINADLIHQLKPDLIIANKEENVKEQVEDLANNYPVWTSNVNSLEDAYKMISDVGTIIQRTGPAQTLLSSITDSFTRLSKLNNPRTAYLIWQNPYMAAGGDTFINAMMEVAGFSNIFNDKRRYPEITVDDLITARCEILLLSSEPFPFKQKHAEEIQSSLSGIRICLVDGEMFSWYGSRMAHASLYLENLINALKKDEPIR